MAAINDVNTLNAAFKVQYADQMQKMVPAMNPLLSKISFVPANQKAGSVFVQPALVSLDQGFTCLGPTDNITNLQNAVMAKIVQASVGSCAYMGRSMMSYSALHRATGGAQAFIDATSYTVESLTRSFSHMMEAQLWYGGAGLATVTAATAALAANSVEITAANAAAFLFVGGEDMPIDFYDPNGLLVLSTTITKVQIGQAYDLTDADKITLVLNSVTGLSNGSVYTIYRKGYRNLESAGLKKILTTDNIFGVDGAQYGLWKANRYTASGALSFSVLSAAIARAIGRGLTGPLMGTVNPRAYRSLMPDYVSIGDGANTNPKARRFDKQEDVKSLVHGVKEMKFIVDSVEVDLTASEFVKGSDGFFISQEDVVRVGSTDATFSTPGFEGQYFFPVSGTNAMEIRVFADFSLFVEALLLR
jgi:hypothetical protein